MQSKRAACLFCGSRERTLTKEHGYGKWMESYFGDEEPGAAILFSRANSLGEVEQGRAPRPHRLHETQPRVACEPCNGALERNLEVHAQRLLPAMFDGTAKRYSETDARLLAAWITKASVVGGVAGAYKSCVLTLNERERLMREAVPPDNTRVFAVNIKPNTFTRNTGFAQSVFGVVKGGIRPLTYNGDYWCIHLRGVAFMLFNTQVPLPFPSMRVEDRPRVGAAVLGVELLQLWPDPQAFSWPTKPADGGEVLALHQVMWCDELKHGPESPGFVPGFND